MNDHYTSLQEYVGKIFYNNYNEILIVCLLGGECGPPFFLCKYIWSSDVYCASPLEVLPHFDDDKKAIKDLDIPY